MVSNIVFQYNWFITGFISLSITSSVCLFVNKHIYIYLYILDLISFLLVLFLLFISHIIFSPIIKLILNIFFLFDAEFSVCHIAIYINRQRIIELSTRRRKALLCWGNYTYCEVDI